MRLFLVHRLAGLNFNPASWRRVEMSPIHATPFSAVNVAMTKYSLWHLTSLPYILFRAIGLNCWKLALALESLFSVLCKRIRPNSNTNSDPFSSFSGLGVCQTAEASSKHVRNVAFSKAKRHFLFIARKTKSNVLFPFLGFFDKDEARIQMQSSQA